MRVAEFLARLAKVEVPGYPGGACLRITDTGDLEYVGPSEVLTDDARRLIREHKDEILAFLRTPIDRIPKSDLALFDYKRTLSKADLDWIDNAVWGNPAGEPTP